MMITPLRRVPPRQIFGLLVALTLFAAGLSAVFSVSFSPTADAAEVPSPPPLLQRTEDVVTADPLPTVQIDEGYVWAQTTIGSTVYAVGDFDNARAPLAAPGTQLTPRSNILAYDINTGALLPFAPQVNGVIKAVAASPDGSRIYIGGSFSSVNGETRWSIAALDARSGQLIPGFSPSVGGTGVYALVAHGSMVYAGGLFTQGNGVARQNVAAFSASNGALMPWAPQTDRQVDAMVADPGGEKIILGGRFSQVNGNTAMRGTAAIDDLTGAVDADWALPQTVKNGMGEGPTAGKAGIFSLAADEDAVYGTGWVFADVNTGNLEGTFAAEADSGDVRWIADCLGDHYGVYSTGETVYTTSHTHACSTMGLHPEQSPRDYTYAEAYTADARGLLGHNPHAGGTYQDWAGTPAPSAYVWYPDFYVGTASGLGQAGLSITGVGDIISMAGEFVGVNGQRYQGIVRFSSNPPQGAQDGPRISGSDWTPTANSFIPGRVRVSVPGNWDRDDKNLIYELRRSGTSTPVATLTVPSTWWDHPGVVLEDPTATPGSNATYTVVVKDGDGNSVTSSPVSTTVADGVADEYTTAVIDDGPQLYYPLGDTMQDWAGANPPIAAGGVVADAPGIANSATGYSDFSGTSEGRVVTSMTTPAPQSFSTELWFRTTSSQGGKLIGYGNAASGDSSSYDRHVYMSNSGEIVFGVYPGGTRTIRSAPGFNDGQWHHVVATQSAAGIVLHLDGRQVAIDPSVTTAQAYTGYWRIGGDNLNGWPERPGSNYFDGDIDEVAVYARALTAAEAATHYGIGTGFEAPTALFTATSQGLDVAVDAGGSSAAGEATITERRWDFGDGSETVTGETATHTYAATGSYTVTLTVVDSNGLSATATRTVEATGPNATPSAEISSSVSGLTVTADGSGSSDIDGQVVSYAWDWGDGETATGQVVSHAYGAAGDYTVTLTVTDDRGGTASTTAAVTATHAAPTAQFTASASGLTAQVDAGGSTAADGATLSYAWDWGDGTEPSAGRTTSHSYAEGGTYTVELTVTDSLGASDSSTQSVTVTSEVFAAADDFERSVASGWGAADVGGAWTSTGWNSAAMSVGEGVGTLVLEPGAGRDMLLGESSVADSGTAMSYTLEGGPSTGSLYVGMKSRYDADGNAYRSLVWHRDNGTMWLVIQRDGTVLETLRLSGQQWAAGDTFQVRTEVVGTSDPTIRMKVWPEGTAEPTGWQLETTDSSAEALADPGSSSVYLYRSGSSAGQAPVHVDDYRLRDLADGAPGVQRAAVTPDEGEALVDEAPASDTEPVGNAELAEAPAAAETSDESTEEKGSPAEAADEVVDPEAVSPGGDDAPAEAEDEVADPGAASPGGDDAPAEAEDEVADPGATSPGDDDAPAEASEPEASEPEAASPGDDDAPAEAADEVAEPEAVSPDPEDEPDSDATPVPEEAPAADSKEHEEVTPVEEGAPATDSSVEDRFDRTDQSGWGEADRGGKWSLDGDAEAILSVTDGNGLLQLAPGTTADVVLDRPSLAVATAELTFHLEEGVEPGGTEVGVILGRNGDLPYRLDASMRPDGSLWLTVHQGDDLIAEQQLQDMTFEPGSAYTLAVSTPEDDGSALTAKLWQTANTEPSDWQLTVAGSDIPSTPDNGAFGLTASRADDAGEHAGIVVEEFTASFRG